LAIQLPGKVFTHFQDWSADLYGGDQQWRSLSAYYCHSFFDAITAGGCWPVQPSPKTHTPTPRPATAAASFCSDELQWWERWVWLVHSPVCAAGLVASLMRVVATEWSSLSSRRCLGVLGGWEMS